MGVIEMRVDKRVSIHSRLKAAANADGGTPPDSLFQYTAA